VRGGNPLAAVYHQNGFVNVFPDSTGAMLHEPPQPHEPLIEPSQVRRVTTDPAYQEYALSAVESQPQPSTRPQ
jgi:hypothetical protein